MGIEHTALSFGFPPDRCHKVKEIRATGVQEKGRDRRGQSPDWDQARDHLRPQDLKLVTPHGC